MSRRLVLRTSRHSSGFSFAVSADAATNGCVIAQYRGVDLIGEIEVPGSLVHSILDGLETAREALPRMPRPAART